MKRPIFWNLLIITPLVAALVACPQPPQTGPDPLTEANAWKGEIPADAEVVTPDEFRRRLASGETELSSAAIIATQKATQDKQYQTDRTTLQNIPNPSENIQALLAEAATNPSNRGDRVVEGPDGQPVMLLGLNTQLRNAAETLERSQSVQNALDDYNLTYSLLPDDLKARAATPESLQGKPLADVKAALEQLNTLLGSSPATLRTARPETSPAQPRANLNAGNGSDNSGACSPQNLVKRYWFPLKNFVSPVKNQGMRGTCWAFSAIGALESRERVQNNNPANLSEQFLVNKVKREWDSSDYVDGGSSNRALGFAVDKGQVFPSEGAWTYNRSSSRPRVTDGDEGSYANSCNGYTGMCSDTAHQSARVCTTFIFKFCSYVKVNYNGAGVAASRTTQLWSNGQGFDLNRYRLLLSRGYTIIASFPIYRGFDEAPSGGENAGVVSNYDKTTRNDKGEYVNGSRGGHVVQIVGFLSNEDMTQFGNTPKIGGGGYFIIKNSWGCSGDGGYYYVPADYVSGLFNDLAVLNFDGRRSDAWNKEQAAPGGSEAPQVQIKVNPARADLRVEKDLAGFFQITHPVAKSVNLTVASDVDGTIYNGGWSTDTNVLFGSSLKRTFATVGRRNLSLSVRYGSSSATASFALDVVNTAPSLNLQFAGNPSQGEDYPISALISDINELDATTLCANTTWSVDAPDTLSATTGCQVSIKFGTTGPRQVRVSTRDSEGLTDSRTISLDVQPPPPNPYPRVLSYGVYSRQMQITGSGQFRYCGDVQVANGNTIDLREKGCNFTITLPDPQRYRGRIDVENPSNETLTYDWNLYVRNSTGEYRLYGENASSNYIFELFPYANAVLVTNDCRVTVKVNAPEASRSKGPFTVWTGKCTYYATRLN
jgi:C1A family cysteine protease